MVFVLWGLREDERIVLVKYHSVRKPHVLYMEQYLYRMILVYNPKPQTIWRKNISRESIYIVYDLILFGATFSNMDKFKCPVSCGMKLHMHSQTSGVHRRWINRTHHNGCNYLSMLKLNLIHISKRASVHHAVYLSRSQRSHLTIRMYHTYVTKMYEINYSVLNKIYIW